VGHLAARTHLFAANLDVKRKAEQSYSSNVNSASFRRRQGAIPPAASGAEQGLNRKWQHTSNDFTIEEKVGGGGARRVITITVTLLDSGNIWHC
jgi:hypothetical protein